MHSIADLGTCQPDEFGYLTDHGKLVITNCFSLELLDQLNPGVTMGTLPIPSHDLQLSSLLKHRNNRMAFRG